MLAALDEPGKILLMDREAKVLSRQDSGLRPLKIAVDSEGKRVALAGEGGRLRIFLRSDAATSMDFLEIEEVRGTLESRDDDRVRYLEL